MNAIKFLKFAAVAVSVVLVGCRGQISKKPPVHPNLNMDMQNRVEAQERVEFFTDNSAMRHPVEGTISRGGLRHDSVLYQGINTDSTFVEENPIQVTKKFLLKGQDNYNVFCTPCHGITGDGQGVIMTGGYGYVPAPSFHQERLRNLADGHIYSVIANGIRNMPSYAHQIPVKERWAIVAYVRALQRSQNVTEEEIEQYDVDLASLKEEFQKKQEAEQAQQEAVAEAQKGSEVSVEQGRTVAENNACMTCHSVDGSKLTGPTWQDAFGHEVELQDGSTVMIDEEYLRESIVDAQAKIVEGYQPVMPNYDYLSDTEVQSLIAYIKSLSDAAPAENNQGESQENTSNTETESDETGGTGATTANTEENQQTMQEDTASTTAAETPDTAASDTTDTAETQAADTTQTLSAAARSGQELFQEYECLSCHTLDGSSELGPPLEGLYGNPRRLANDQSIIADEGYIKESIQYPEAKIAFGYIDNMPSYRDLMTDQELDAVTEYIKTLSDQQ